MLAAGSYASSSNTIDCPIASYELRNSADTMAFSDSAITFNTATGELNFNNNHADTALKDLKFKIKIKGISGLALDTTLTNEINIVTVCGPHTVTSITKGTYPGPGGLADT